LYLVHVPIGGRVMNAATRVELGPFSATLVTLAAFLVAVAAAYAFHVAVERPARRWAAGIKYGRQNRPSEPACAASPVPPW